MLALEKACRASARTGHRLAGDVLACEQAGALLVDVVERQHRQALEAHHRMHHLQCAHYKGS
jgi:hypothetical protein